MNDYQSTHLPPPEKKPIPYRIMNIPISRNTETQNVKTKKSDNLIDNDIEEITVKEFDKDYIKNKVFEQNIETQPEGPNNLPMGNCQPITFWQFAKLTRMGYDVFSFWLKKTLEISSEIDFLYYCFLRPIWDKIIIGEIKSWRYFENRNQVFDDLHYTNMDSKFKLFGEKSINIDDLEKNFLDDVVMAIFGLNRVDVREKVRENLDKLQEIEDEEDWGNNSSDEEAKEKRRQEILQNPYIAPKDEDGFRKYIEFMSQYTHTIPFPVFSVHVEREYESLIHEPLDFWPPHTDHVYVMVYDTERHRLYDFNNVLESPLLIPENDYGCPEISGCYLGIHAFSNLGAEIVKIPPINKTGYFDPGLKTIENISLGSKILSDKPKHEVIEPNYTAALCFDMFIQITRQSLDDYIELFKTLAPKSSFPPSKLNLLCKCFTNVFEKAKRSGIFESQEWLLTLYNYRILDSEIFCANEEVYNDLTTFIELYIELTTGHECITDQEFISGTNQGCSEEILHDCIEELCSRFKYAPLFNLAFITTYGTVRYVFRQYGFTFYTQENLNSYKAPKNSFITVFPSDVINGEYPNQVNDGFIAAFLLHKYESVPFPRYPAYEIRDYYIKPLYDEQKNMQLTNAYNPRIS